MPLNKKTTTTSNQIMLYIYIYIYIYIYEHSSEELPAAAYAQKESSSHELSTLVVDKYICEYIPKKFLRLH